MSDPAGVAYDDALDHLCGACGHTADDHDSQDEVAWCDGHTFCECEGFLVPEPHRVRQVDESGIEE